MAFFWQKYLRQGQTLALATLGGTTHDRIISICVTSPMVAKASIVVTIVCSCRWQFHLKSFAMGEKMALCGIILLSPSKSEHNFNH